MQSVTGLRSVSVKNVVSKLLLSSLVIVRTPGLQPESFLQPLTIIKGRALNYTVDGHSLAHMFAWICFLLLPHGTQRVREKVMGVSQIEGNKQGLICPHVRMRTEIPVCSSKLLSVRAHTLKNAYIFFGWTSNLCGCWCVGTSEVLTAWQPFSHEKAETSKDSSKSSIDRQNKWIKHL